MLKFANSWVAEIEYFPGIEEARAPCLMDKFLSTIVSPFCIFVLLFDPFRKERELSIV